MNVASEDGLVSALKEAVAQGGKGDSAKAFYDVLLNWHVFVVGTTGQDNPDGGAQVVLAGDQVHIQEWQNDAGEKVVPFFSSLEMMRLAMDGQGEVPYMEMESGVLFELTAGMTLVMNPKSECSKVFPPEEVERLLGVVALREQEAGGVPSGGGVFKPERRPKDLIVALCYALKGQRRVSRAWLGEVRMDGEDEKPSWLVGVEVSGDEGAMEEVERQVSGVMLDNVGTKRHYDVVRVTEGAGGDSAALMGATEPFYVKQKGLLGRLFGG